MKDYLCFKHHDRSAVGMCNQCHRPYCEECKTETPLGVFCTFECSGKFAAFYARYREPKLARHYIAPILTSLVLLAALALGAAWAGHRFLGIGALEKYDLIGRYLK